MSYSDASGSTDQSSTSMGSFLMPRDPSITKPWMRPRPARGKDLCDLFEDDVSYDSIVQDQHLKVFLRVKPATATATATRYFKQAPYEIQSKRIFTLQEETKSSKKHVQVKKSYSFSHIFHDENNTQYDIYKYIIKENFAKFIDGNDYTIMTYGSSGSGKTYSLMGTEDEPGIIPRCLESLFKAIKVDRLPQVKPVDNCFKALKAAEKEDEVAAIQSIVKSSTTRNTVAESLNDSLASYRRQSILLQAQLPNHHKQQSHKLKYEVWVSFAEIYNEAIYDLLRERSPISNQPLVPLRLFHANNSKPYIKGLRWVYVRSGEEAYAALERGRRLLKFARTNMNSHSSRSHCIFSVRLVQYTDIKHVSMSTFRLCDLAGSERAKRTGNEGLRLNESKSINSSLHVLEKCLTILRSQHGLPPFRESKLTSLLQNALCGNEAIGMLVTMNSDPKYFDETQHTLQFSAIAKDIRIIEPNFDNFHKSKSCVDITDHTSRFSTDMNYEISYLKEEIIRIKREHEQYVQKMEMEIRQSLMKKVMLLKKESDDDFEKRKLKEKEQDSELHQFEIKRLERTYENIIKELQDENESLKRNISNLMKKETVRYSERQSFNTNDKNGSNSSVRCDEKYVNEDKVSDSQEINLKIVKIEKGLLEVSLKNTNIIECINNDIKSEMLELSLNISNTFDITNNDEEQELLESIQSTDLIDEKEDNREPIVTSINKTHFIDKKEDYKELLETSLTKTNSIDKIEDDDKKSIVPVLNKTNSIENNIGSLESSLNKTNYINNDGNVNETYDLSLNQMNHIDDSIESNEIKSDNDEELIIKESSSDVWEDATDQHSTEIFANNENTNVNDQTVDKKSLCTSIISKSILDESEIYNCMNQLSLLNLESIEKTFENKTTCKNESSTNVSSNRLIFDLLDVNKTTDNGENSNPDTVSESLKVDLNSSFINTPKNEPENTDSIESSEMSDDYIKISDNSDGSKNNSQMEINQNDEKSVECVSSVVAEVPNMIFKLNSKEPNKQSKLKLKRKTHCVSETAVTEKNKAVSFDSTVNILSRDVQLELPVVNLEDFITPMKKVVKIHEANPDKENCNLNKFDTEKKGKPEELYSLKKGAMTVGSSRRKLFAKRENNEKAAETREPIRSHRHLTFEEDSPGAIHPPEVEKPYIPERKKIDEKFLNEKKAIRSPYSLRKKK